VCATAVVTPKSIVMPRDQRARRCITIWVSSRVTYAGAAGHTGSPLFQQRLLRMFLVVNQLAVGVLFLVYLFLLRWRQVSAVGFEVRMLLLLNGAIVGA